MIAMQYSFTLPADYDMDIIDRRIREKGPLLDGFPHLRFKSYLSSRKSTSDVGAKENLYAPFYLWDDPRGADAFLSGPGFAAVTRDFGWPRVQTWIVWGAEFGGDLRSAWFASRELGAITPHADLAARRAEALANAQTALRQGALAAVAAFDPTNWTTVQFQLWSNRPTVKAEGAQIYDVGHVSL